jgi:hypothetical protein
MKIAIVFGKGLDGCGVEKFGYEFQRYMPDDVDIYDLQERGFTRSGGHIKDSISFKAEEIPEVAKKLNDNYDIVMLNSYPSPLHKQSTVKSFFEDLVLKIEKPILVGMMHEIKRMNFDRIPLHVPIANRCDIIFNFSTETSYAKDISSILTDKKLGERIARMKLPFTVSDYEKYWVPFKDKRRSCIYASRWTTMKDPKRMVDMFKLDKDFHYSIHGIERSIGAKFDIIDITNWTDKFEGYNYDSDICESFGPYEYEDGMNLISNSMFGYSGYNLPKERHNYGDRFEYAQMEIIAVGTVPVFDWDYGMNNVAEGSTFISNPIAIWSNREDLNETKDKIHELSNDEAMYNDYLEAGIQFLRQEADASNVIPPMLKHIETVGKQTDKMSVNQLVEKCFGKTAIDTFTDILNNHIPAFGAKEYIEQQLSYFEKKKRIVHTKIKDLNTTSLEEFFG